MLVCFTCKQQAPLAVFAHKHDKQGGKGYV